MHKVPIGIQYKDITAQRSDHHSWTYGDYSGMPDRIIVQHIRQGDSRAFEEMVRRYRSQLHRFVRGIIQDDGLADDVVQEGLIRAFMHMDQLLDADRLLAWLQRIVRNQAYSHVQRKIRLREQYFSSFTAKVKHSSAGTSWSEQDSLDQHLNQWISPTALQAQEEFRDPFYAAAAEDMNQYVHQLLAGLHEKERLVCYHHWIEYMSPQEIAIHTNLSTANVYQILSRSRKKVTRHHIQQAVNEMLAENSPSLPQCVVLREPQTFRSPLTWSSAAAAIHEMLSYLGPSVSLPMVMGCSGLAFRITIYPADIHIAGPTAFNFKEVLGRGLRHMGYLPSAVEAAASEAGLNANLVDPVLLQDAAKDKRMLNPRLVRALSMIRYSVSRGLPAVVWDLNIPEFGLIYGYDDQIRKLHGVDFIQAAAVPYDHLGRGVNEEIFVLTVEPERMREEIHVQAVLQDILAHYKGSDPYSLPGTICGLGAYAAWREALREGKVEPNGHAYNIAVLRDARHYASEFFRGLTQLWTGSADQLTKVRLNEVKDVRMSMHLNRLIDLSQLAEGQYRLIADRLYRLVQYFPFPDGGKPNHKVHADKAISVLHDVEQLESSAVTILEEMLDTLENMERNLHGTDQAHGR